MAQTARTITDNVAEFGKSFADKVGDAGHNGVQNMQKAAEESVKLGRGLDDLLNEQVRSNADAFKALTETVDWGKVAQIQIEFLRASMERTTQVAWRYLEMAQAAVTSAAKEEAKKAA